MPTRRIALPFLLLIALLAGCSKSDPQAALEAAVQQLQDNIEAKRTSAVLDQLHPQFSAQGQNDREWAQRTMALMFMRFKNIKVLALSKDSQVDPTYRDKGQTKAQIAVTGAEGLIPESANHYSVTLEWLQDDGEWKLARLTWE